MWNIGLPPKVIVDETPNPNARPLPSVVRDLQGNIVQLVANEKLDANWTIHENMKYLFDDVFHSTLGSLSFLGDFNQPLFCRYDNRVRELLRDENNILYLREKRGMREMRKVFENGQFITTLGSWLMESRQGSGDDNEYRCFTSHQGIIIKDHQIIGLLKYGEVGLLGIDGIYENNHLDRDTFNNKGRNIILGTKKENLDHKEMFREIQVLKNRNGRIGFNL